MENRVVVHTTENQFTAEVIKGKLEAEGINTLVLNKRDSSYGTFGILEIHVLEADAERAKQIIAESNE